MNYTTQMNYSIGDKFCLVIDRGLRTVFGQPKITERENPARYIKDSELSQGESKLAACLMRVNHTGEVCAQALYEGQSITARDAEIHKQMQVCAMEENDHLDWCESRLKELGSHTSFLNPIWYAGSLAIGTLAGLAGDKWSLGFLAETENQVTKHLKNHLDRIPENDRKSQAILDQMVIDESEHEKTAQDKGAADLPFFIKKAMSATSKIMTRVSYFI